MNEADMEVELERLRDLDNDDLIGEAEMERLRSQEKAWQLANYEDDLDDLDDVSLLGYDVVENLREKAIKAALVQFRASLEQQNAQ